MASIATSNTLPSGMSFPGPLGAKRRRMRSGGNVSTLSNNNNHNNTNNTNIINAALLELDDDSGGEGKGGQGCKAKGATTIPIFLKKTYKMIDTCDHSIASWTDDGEMFVVKDPDTFATQVIPQYFDHNKFSSFARQLNFYGFRKMQSKPIRNSDFDAQTAKHVTFFNENFKRGRCDLLKNIQRSTRGGGATNPQDQQREVQNLRDQVQALEQRVEEMSTEVEDRMRRLELDMLARMEQMMLAFQQQTQQQQTHQQQQQTQQQQQQTHQQQHSQIHLQPASSVGTANSTNHRMMAATAQPVHPAVSVNHQQQQQQQHWGNNNNANAYAMSAATINPRSSSINSVLNTFQEAEARTNNNQGPTLPPHPKQKQLPMNGMLSPNVVGVPNRLNSLRGLSTLSRGLSGLSRGASVESSASAVLMRNSWEDKFFSMLMLGETEQNAAAAADGVLLGPTPIAPGATPSNGMGHPQQHSSATAPLIISNDSLPNMRPPLHSRQNENDELSDVSDSGLQ